MPTARRLVSSVGLWVLLVVCGCGNGAARQRAIAALGLTPVAGGPLLRTPEGCRVQSVVAGRRAVAVAHADDTAHVLTNPSGTVSVKAVGLDGRCARQLRLRLRRLP